MNTEALVKRVESYMPDGDGYNSQYAHDLAEVVEILKALSQQEAEPVAYVVTHSTGGNAGLAKHAAWLPHSQSVEPGDKLYLHPPKPAPLPQPDLYMCRNCGWHGRDSNTHPGFCSDFYMEAIPQQEKEKLAQWMLSRSIATGHGDTIDDLIATLEAHWAGKSVPQGLEEFIAEYSGLGESCSTCIPQAAFRAFLAQREAQMAGKVIVPVSDGWSFRKVVTDDNGGFGFTISKEHDGIRTSTAVFPDEENLTEQFLFAVLSASQEGV